MTREQAIRMVEKALTPTLNKLAFGANLYDIGSRASFAVKAHKERQKIRKAMEILTVTQTRFL